MFTGIVEEIGTVRAVRRGARSIVLEIAAETIMEDIHSGDSIAVNGVCLTASGLGKDYFAADVMPETLHRSSLRALQTGSHVNLERAMAAGGRFGGHIVSGHIDGTGTILGIRRDDNAVWYEIRTDENILRYIVEKGSIAIDGISLTVAGLTESSFSVSVIPHTLAVTILGEKHEGSIVNLENDIIGKYVERLLISPTAKTQDSGITNRFLAAHGYL